MLLGSNGPDAGVFSDLLSEGWSLQARKVNAPAAYSEGASFSFSLT